MSSNRIFNIVTVVFLLLSFVVIGVVLVMIVSA